MKISGHKPRAVFDRYGITSLGDLEAAAARIEAGAKPGGQPTPATTGTITGTKREAVVPARTVVPDQLQ